MMNKKIAVALMGLIVFSSLLSAKESTKPTARIKVLEEEEATGPIKKAFERMKKKQGHVPNAAKLYALSPALFFQTNRLSRSIMEGKGWDIEPRTRLLIAALVSYRNECPHCVPALRGRLKAKGWEEEKIGKFFKDFTQVGLDDKTVAILGFADKVNRDPKSVTDGDIEALKKQGLSDKAILEVTFVAANIKASNTVYQALGLEPTPVP